MRILVIEDSTVLRDALRSGLTRSGHEVESAADGATGLRMATQRSYEVIVLDLLLPGLPGLEVLARLRAAGSAVHVLLLTALDAVEDRVKGLQSGADDYLVKPFAFTELVARLEALCRRQHGHKQAVICVEDLEVDTAGRRVTRAGVEILLTHREFRLIEFLAHRRGEIVTRTELEEHLYGTHDLPLSNVIDSAVCSIRAKLRRHGGPTLIHTRPRIGYVLGSGAA